MIPPLLDATDPQWMNNPDRPCRTPIDHPTYIRDHADTYYPRDKYYDQAKKLCDGCPVKTPCLAYALDNREEHGLWGGTTPNERAALLRRRDGAVA